VKKQRSRGLVIGGIVFIALNTVLREVIGGIQGDVIAGVVSGGLGALIFGAFERRNKKAAAEGSAKESDDTQELKGWLRKFGASRIGALLYLAQILLVFLAAIPMVLIFFFDVWFFSGAYEAIDVLEGYLLWHQVGLGSIGAWFVLAIIGNFIIIRLARRTGHGMRGYLVVGVVIVLTLGLVAGRLLIFDEEEGLWPGMQEIRADIAAIEDGELLTNQIRLDLNHTSNYRTASLQDMGEYRPLYVMNFSQMGRTYLPRSLSPSYLREIASNDAFQFPGLPEYARVFAVTYTPTLQLIVSATPVAGVDQGTERICAHPR